MVFKDKLCTVRVSLLLHIRLLFLYRQYLKTETLISLTHHYIYNTSRTLRVVFEDVKFEELNKQVKVLTPHPISMTIAGLFTTQVVFLILARVPEYFDRTIPVTQCCVSSHLSLLYSSFICI